MTSDNVKIAILQTQMDNVKKQVDEGFKEMGDKLDKINVSISEIKTGSDDKYSTKQDLTGLRVSFQAEIDSLNRKTGWNKLLSNILTAIISPLIVYLIVYVITHR